MFFSDIMKNLNWKILSKNLVTFKRWDGQKRGGGGVFGGGGGVDTPMHTISQSKIMELNKMWLKRLGMLKGISVPF